MWKNICEIQVACNPINSNATNSIGSNSIFYYRLELSTIRPNAENAIPDSSVEFDPVYPVLGIMYINMEDMVT